MRMFLVTFRKTVADGRGRDHRVVQRQLPVRAASETAAVWEAKALFCRNLGVPDWRFRADECAVAEIRATAA